MNFRQVFWAAIPILLGLVAIGFVMITVEEPERRRELALTVALATVALEWAVCVPLLLLYKLRSQKLAQLQNSLKTEVKPSIWSLSQMGTPERLVVAFMFGFISLTLLGWGEAQTAIVLGEGFDGDLDQARKFDGAFHGSNSWFRFSRTPLGLVFRLLGAVSFLLAVWVMPESEKKE